MNPGNELDSESKQVEIVTIAFEPTIGIKSKL